MTIGEYRDKYGLQAIMKPIFAPQSIVEIAGDEPPQAGFATPNRDRAYWIVKGRFYLYEDDFFVVSGIEGMEEPALDAETRVYRLELTKRGREHIAAGLLPAYVIVRAESAAQARDYADQRVRPAIDEQSSKAYRPWSNAVESTCNEMDEPYPAALTPRGISYPKP